MKGFLILVIVLLVFWLFSCIATVMWLADDKEDEVDESND